MTNEHEEDMTRIGWGVFTFLLTLQLPVLFMWLSGYAGIYFPLWLGLNFIILFYFRWRTTSYIIKVGAINSNLDLRTYQEVRWVPLLIVPMGLGLSSMLRISQSAGPETATYYACNSVFVMAACGGLIEGIRRIRF
ncbi:hypothetical protein [Rhizobium alvei]|uniref:Transmembrane protein n=1 Tax=Rhizobium alvei TaxID=1132659 RepID=A0ABT8YJC8_9HYPH|nr:hypothetical protein [Rhizobium alvei]MDO6963812.1 hypothetical protein [Rhizobium alvei]